MSASRQWKILSVRLTESDLRRFKSIAASRGLKLQEAVHQALEAWMSLVPRTDPAPLDTLQSSLASVDIENTMHADKEAELAEDLRWV
jgi:hypothetical protein